MKFESNFKKCGLTQVCCYDLTKKKKSNFDIIKFFKGNSVQGEGKSQVLEGDSKTWKLVTVHENRHRGIAPEFCLRFLQVK